MKLRIAFLVAVVALCFAALREHTNTVSAATPVATSDPCTASTLKLSVAITSNPADLVAPVSGESVYVCGFGFGSSATNGTERLGAEASAGQCALNTDTQLTGNLGLSTSPIIVGNNRQTVLVTASGAGLCSSASSSSGNGFVTYVQK